MDAASGAIGLLAGAISYMLGVCAPIGPAEMMLPTPCADWDLAMLLGHLCRSMSDLETALRTGQLDLEEPASAGGDPVEVLRDRAAQLLCAGYCFGGPERFVAVGGLPMPAGLVACTGAVEIAVHGWDVSAARARAGRDSAGRDSAGRDSAGCGADVRGTPIPAGLAARMLRLSPLLVAGREGLFAVPVEVPAQASPGDRLVGYLGRNPGAQLWLLVSNISASALSHLGEATCPAPHATSSSRTASAPRSGRPGLTACTPRPGPTTWSSA